MLQLKAVLSNIYDDDAISTTPVLILQLENKNDLSKIVTLLDQSLPMNQLRLNHLKRINSREKNLYQVLICPASKSGQADENDDSIIEETINSINSDLREFLTKDFKGNFKICNVPASASLTRTQYQKMLHLWPMVFHENKYIARCLSGTIFSKERLQNIFQLISDTLSLLDKSSAEKEEKEKGNSDKKVQVSTIITRNEGKEIVTRVVTSSNDDHPLHHAIIMAVSNVSDLHSKLKKSIIDLDDNNNNDSGITPEMIERYKDDYLCTDYECFISQEPCIMCAMALVHSRIKRIFFYKAELSINGECNDQPYTVHELHANPNINHRYEAWMITKKIPITSEKTVDST